MIILVSAAWHIFCNQGSTVFKKIGHLVDRGQIVKSHKICVFDMFSLSISL